MRPLGTIAAALTAAMVASPAHAAPSKRKPLRGSYHLTTAPNPTLAVSDTALAGDGCQEIVPGGVDNHPLRVPAKGRLSVVLDSPDPSGGASPYGPDWDLWLLDPDGTVRNGSSSEHAHEAVTETFRRGQMITIQVCNLAGLPDATVSWVFTFA